jgi:hypothetical protein
VTHVSLWSLVSTALPKSVETFGCVDGVWVTDFRFVVPLAVALRQSLIEIGCARQAHKGQETKMELVYRYLTGPNFKHRVAKSACFARISAARAGKFF